MADRNLRLQVILEGLDKLTAPLKSITGASSAARRDLARTAEELQHLDKLQKQIGSYKAKESAFGADTRKLQETNARMAELRAQIDATEKPTKKLAKEFEQAERQAAALTTRLDKGGAELQQLSAKLSAAGVDVSDLARHEDRLSERTEQANRALRQQTAQLEKVSRAKRNSDKLNEMSTKATGMGLGMIAAGAATGAPVLGAIKQAATLESAMADVSKVTNMTRPQIERMSNDFIDMSEKIPMAANELATIAAAAGAAGVGMDKFGKPMTNQRQQLLEFTNDAAEMGVAFDMTADQAGETMAKWRTAFELPQAGVRALGDGVNALTNRFGGKAANVTDIITRIGPLGKVAGLAAPEIAALGSTLDSIGIPSEVAATGIKNTMLALTKGAAATKSQQEAFKALGLDATDVGKRMQTDAAGAITDVMERIGRLDADKQSGIMTQLFGSESVAAIAPMLTNLDGLKQRLKLVADEGSTAGSMHGEFLNRIATTEGAVGLATNGLSGLNITMGKALLPTVVKVAGYVKDASGAVRGWAQENPKLAKAIMIFLGVGAGLLVLLGGLALAFAALTAAAAPLGISLLPLLAIVAAIAAVAAAAYLIYDNWGAISAWFASLWETIKGLFSGALDYLVQAFLNFTPLGLMTQAFAPMLGYLRSLNFAEIGRNLIQGLINGITSMLGRLKSTVLNTASAVANWFASKLGIHSPSRVFASLGGFVMAGLDQGLAANTSTPLSRITDLSGQMTRALAVGAGAGAIAATGIAPAAAQGPVSAATSRMATGNTYHIKIEVSGGAGATDISDEVRKAIEAIEREREGRGFGDT
ncbi:phage tail tape measure protein [Novosphingobium sp. HII-3]|uniref:phage tail tape measure protein n=1 Tax=Novosphingobium sp. HII-3 TaxID=2075565 RepID=UPI000CDADAE1|nr:phage tail tape measure protein [Novosphingobium sp. HII-3]